MLARVIKAGILPAALLLVVSCAGSDGAVDAGPVDLDPGTTPPADVLDDVPDVPLDVPVPPPEEHKVPIGAEDLTFHVGPHVMHTTQASVAIVWETEEAGGTRVEYGSDDSYGSQIEGDAGTMHEVVVTGLAPATVYHYRACTDERCTADLTFATAPVPGQKFRFAVYGDSRSDPISHGAVAQSMIQSEPALVLNMGDIVGNGDRPQYKEQHFDPTRHLGHYVPIYVSIGNHEWKEAEAIGELDVPNFREYLAFPEVPEHRIGELSYSFTFGDAFFIALDNTIDGADIFFPLGEIEPPLAEWLREQAESDEARNAKWRFAFMHYPPASPCHEDWMMLTSTRDHVVPLLRDNGFHALFAGHVHDYERQDWDGFPVLVTGGGGAELEDITLCTFVVPELVEMYSAYHHLTVDLGEDTAHVRAVSLQGEVFDEITIDQAGPK